MPNALRKLMDRNGFLSCIYNLPRLVKGYQPIFLDYRVEPKPRFGYGRPAHEELNKILSANNDQYAALLTQFANFSSDFLKIPRNDSAGLEPCWVNKWLEGLDTVALYGFVASRNPALFLEIGSGFSTKLVRRAIRDHGLKTTLVSIDPHPRAQIDKLCDEVVRQPLENCDPAIVDRLQPGDILFFDGSHRSFMNSDVTVFFLEFLPRLKPGTLVHIHDIYLPFDYPPDRAHWFYSEQYLLAASLLAGHNRYDVILPNNYVANTPALTSPLDPLWENPLVAGVPRTGTSFWIETR